MGHGIFNECIMLLKATICYVSSKNQHLSIIITIHTPLLSLPSRFKTPFFQCRKVAFDGALAHRQSLLHLFAGDCRRLFDEIKYFLLTLSEFRLRHISVIVSDIRGVGRGKDDGLELGRSGFEFGF